MCNGGEHQICTLSCGHLFGYNCISDHFVYNQSCPICGKQIKQKDIRLLFFDNHYSQNSTDIDDIRAKISVIEKKRDKLLYQKEEVLRKLSDLNKTLNSNSRQNQNTIHIESRIASHPSIVVFRRVNDGCKVVITKNFVVYSCKEDEEYSITVTERDTFQTFNSLRLHSLQIRDISPHPSCDTIASVSLDTYVCIVDLTKGSIVKKIHINSPLWSCCWINDKTLLLGSQHGKLFKLDSLTGSIVTCVSVGSMPFYSIAYLWDNTIYLANGKNGIVYDLSKSSIISSIDNAFLVKKSPNSSLFTVLTRKDGSCQSHIFRISKSKTIEHVLNFSIPYFAKLCNPGLYEIGGQHFFVHLSSKPSDISITCLTNVHHDIWEQWKGRFCSFQDHGDILDISISFNQELCIALVTSSHFRLITVPVPH